MSISESVLPAAPVASFIASVDAACVAYSDPAGGGPVTVLDADSGTLLEVVPLPVGARLIGWYDDEHLLTRTGDRLEVVDLDGTVVRSVPVPEILPTERVRLNARAPRGEGAVAGFGY